MDDYDIIKEDVDNMMEISTWDGQPDAYSKLDSKVCVCVCGGFAEHIVEKSSRTKRAVVQLTVHCFDRCLLCLS